MEFLRSNLSFFLCLVLVAQRQQTRAMRSIPITPAMMA